MTRRVVGSETRSGRSERVRFAWALLFSLSLHASVLALQAGPRPGRPATSALAGGVLQATLRPATPDASPPSSQVAAITAQIPAPQLPLIEAAAAPAPNLPAPTPVPPVVQRPAPAAPSSGSQQASPQRDGLDVGAGAAAAGDSSLAIPALPPMLAMNKLPRRPSLLAPLHFAYPQNIRVQGGRVRVRILLDDQGKVEEMRVIHAAPPGVFDLAALSVLRSARFAPGFVGPIALRSYLFMEVTFGPGPQGQQVWYAGDTRAPSKLDQ